MLNNFVDGHGFVKSKDYNENPLGTAKSAFYKLQDDYKKLEKRLTNMQEDNDLEKEEWARQTDCMSRAVKQLQD